jgi:hypothetical protein
MNGIEGDKLLVNGKIKPQIRVEAGKPFILRLINASISRYWRLSLPGSRLIRIGGEGGLLDHAILEGGTKMAMKMDTGMGMKMGMDMPMMTSSKYLGFDEGEILVASGMRATVVVNPPQESSIEMNLVWRDFNRGIHSMNMDMMNMQTCMNDETCLDPAYPKCMQMQEGGMAKCGAMMDEFEARGDVDVLTINKTKNPKGGSHSPFDVGTVLQAQFESVESQSLASLSADKEWKGMMNRIILQGDMTPTGTSFTIDNVHWSYGTDSTDSLPASPHHTRGFYPPRNILWPSATRKKY